jgi:WD40 repeat protein
LYRFRDHTNFLWAAAFSPDGRWVLTGGGGIGAGAGKFAKGTDFALRLWKMPDEAVLAGFASGN